MQIFQFHPLNKDKAAWNKGDILPGSAETRGLVTRLKASKRALASNGSKTMLCIGT